MSDLIHVVYASRETEKFDPDSLKELLNIARTNNHSKDVSGMLLYSEGSFFQVLEGEPDAVRSLYDKIGQDPRHDRVIKIIEEPIKQRSFDQWSMGYVGASPDELKRIDGLNDFFNDKGCLTELGAGRAKTLLGAFSSGRWQS